MAKILKTDMPQEGIYELTDDAPDYAPINQPVIAKAIRGARYDQFVEEGWARKIAYGEIGLREGAKLCGLSAQVLSGYVAAYVEDERKVQVARYWEMSEGAKEEIGWGVELELVNLTKLIKAFKKFREHNFLTHEKKPYVTAGFHLDWIRGILRALCTGGRITILSPPRHGKTDLLVHFVIWLLIRNPNMRILWVGGNKDIAVLSVDQARSELEDNEKLREKFLPPNHSFKPQTRSGTWSSSQFEIATRTLTLKAPSVVAVGRGGKLLSRDTDFIITDDLEDHDSTVQEGERKKTRGWFNQNLGTRKEAHTAWANIGSRQHMDDLHGHLLENNGWQHIVEKAHDISVCDVPLHGPDHTFIPEEHPRNCKVCKAHDNYGCVLFPEIRNMWFLMEQYKTMEPDYPGFFEMNYNNNPQDAGVKIFDRDEINACQNPYIRMGHLEDIREREQEVEGKIVTHTFTHLVAGLDPSYSGYQTSFLWAFNMYTGKRYVMDIENRKGGGIPQARETIASWYEKYDLRHWVIETNLYKKGIIEDEKLVDYCSTHAIRLEGWETYTNKWDPQIGVTSLGPRFRDKEIVLPTGDQQSQAKVNEYRKQLLSFNADAAARRGVPLDIVMASWFPETVFRRLIKDRQSETLIEYDQMYYPEDMMGDEYEFLME